MDELLRGITNDFDDDERIIYVKGKLLPLTSQDPSYTFSDLDNEGIRPFKTGVLRRNRIRSNVMSIGLQWENIPASMAEEILELIRDQTFTVNVYDRTLKKRVNKTMYASADKDYSERKYIGGYVSFLSFSLVEC